MSPFGAKWVLNGNPTHAICKPASQNVQDKRANQKRATWQEVLGVAAITFSSVSVTDAFEMQVGSNDHRWEFEFFFQVRNRPHRYLRPSSHFSPQFVFAWFILWRDRPCQCCTSNHQHGVCHSCCWRSTRQTDLFCHNKIEIGLTCRREEKK